MMVDLYTKAVLTVIAAALVILVAENTVQRAGAQSSCGSQSSPCYITNHLIDGVHPLTVHVK
jgi:hypothetical protein